MCRSGFGNENNFIIARKPQPAIFDQKNAVFASSRRIQNRDESGPTSPSCSTPLGLDSVSTDVVRKKLTGSADKPLAVDQGKSFLTHHTPGCLCQPHFHWHLYIVVW